ncbi:MAG: DUF5615 family PIN-like protein [Planctomycetes bacterium]|nr:DUF5615 family PIN-like protein [Planctomycetota bacterium]
MLPRILLDEHLSPEVAQILNQRGIDSLAIAKTPFASFEDSAVLDLAIAQGRIIVTKNKIDFEAEIRRRAAEHGGSLTLPGAFWIRGKRTVYKEDFARLAAAIEQEVRRVERGEIDPTYGVWLSF